MKNSRWKTKKDPAKMPDIFCSVETLAALNEAYGNPGEQDSCEDFILDVIEIPMFCIFTADSSKLNAHFHKRLIVRNFDVTEDDALASVSVDRKTFEGSINAPDSLEEMVSTLLGSCLQINRFIHENGLEELYDDLDPEDEGILLYVENERVSAKVVSGKARPALMCAPPVGSPSMFRPYKEDIMNGLRLENMSLEEKIAAAEDGDGEMADVLYNMYLAGTDDVPQNFEKAAYWAHKGAEAGNTVAQFNLGVLYAKGAGVERDFKKAIYWTQKAAENGDEDAIGNLETFRKADEYLTAAEAGDSQAQAEYAGILVGASRGLPEFGPDKDLAECYEWYKKSASAMCLDGLYGLGLCYAHGRGVKKDDVKAFRLYERAAQKGHAPSQHNLACVYMNGDGVEKNPEEAAAWWTKSAAQGYALAEKALGYFYSRGDLYHDTDKAIELFRSALEKGSDPDVCYELGICYSDPGDDFGVKSLEEAAKWFALAAASGNEKAKFQAPVWGFLAKRKAEGLLTMAPEEEALSYVLGLAKNGDEEAIAALPFIN